ncbi:MAG: DNA-protecting protein DprA [Clostridia bacterium]|nr:DNA-protecting protein DprA [Clostridia bacterium]
MNNIYDVWFSTVKLNNKTKKHFLELYGAEKVWNMDEKELLNEFTNYSKDKVERLICEILDLEKRNKIEKYFEYMNKLNISLISYKDKEYPSILKNIDDCPIYLYTRGSIENLYKDNIAIVGARYASGYGKKVAFELSKYACDNNIGVVSGLAIRCGQICSFRQSSK